MSTSRSTRPATTTSSSLGQVAADAPHQMPICSGCAVPADVPARDGAGAAPASATRADTKTLSFSRLWQMSISLFQPGRAVTLNLQDQTGAASSTDSAELARHVSQMAELPADSAASLGVRPAATAGVEAARASREDTDPLDLARSIASLTACIYCFSHVFNINNMD